MKLIFNNIALKKSSVVAFGNFDGLHLGHQYLMHRLVKLAEQEDCTSLALTFNPTTSRFFKKETTDFYLTSVWQKIRKFEELGIDVLAFLTFNREFACISPQDFIREILVKRCKAKYIIVGENAQFGYQRSGNIQLLRDLSREYKYEVVEVPKFDLNGKNCSSSNIRAEIEAGNIEKANLLLGRDYSICGFVGYGRGRGRFIGVPTANLEIGEMKYPKFGVYIVKVWIEGKSFRGLANFGIRPTFDENYPLLEVHIATDNNINLYNKLIDVRFLKFIRSEQKFNSVEQLKSQLAQDLLLLGNFA